MVGLFNGIWIIITRLALILLILGLFLRSQNWFYPLAESLVFPFNKSVEVGIMDRVITDEFFIN